MSDGQETTPGVGAVTIDQLIALNDEIVAMTRAGVPLEQGLLGLGSDVRGKLGRIAKAIGEGMSRGESLPEALASSGAGVPKVYRAVVEAGLRSGRLSVALEGMSACARGYSEARRSIGSALWYPLLVSALAYALFVAVVTLLVPRFLTAFTMLGVPVHPSLLWLGAAGEHVWIWGPVIPTALAVFAVGWLATGRGVGGFSTVLRVFPWMGPMMRGYEAAGYADMLALLVEHRVPYPEALTLAGEATGAASLSSSSRALAAGIERGLSPGEALSGRSAFPPLLRWLLATAPGQNDMAASLRVMADRYRARARFQADKIRVFLPALLMFGIGGTATLLYALALFVPLTTLWVSLSRIAP